MYVSTNDCILAAGMHTGGQLLTPELVAGGMWLVVGGGCIEALLYCAWCVGVVVVDGWWMYARYR